MFSYPEEIIPILHILFQRIEKEETQSMKSVLHYFKIKKKNVNKNWKPISLMNIDTKIFNKILENQIQQCIKRIIHHKQVGFIPDM